MRHRKDTFKLGRDSSHRRCLVANLLKSLVVNERIETTVAKAKELRRHAERLITIAKKQSLASKRHAIGKLMVRYNTLTPKEQRAAKGGKTFAYNEDRKVITKLFGQLAERFSSRNGGYTRIIKHRRRVGDNAPLCYIEYLPE
ncbi:MAG: 50S ribosomal protein L17 [Chlamydiae bacterium]|nr:50S ribosomal protein L17 [Chlamydiota bacterium]